MADINGIDEALSNKVPLAILRNEEGSAWINRQVTEASRAAGRTPVPLIQIEEFPSPLEPEAFHGVAGDIVRVIEPHTEADPAALLIQLLVFFGNAIGRSAHFMVESTQHCFNLFSVIVGDTSQGRKGTSLEHIRRIFKMASPEWHKERILKGGLASGEGLIWAVRDPSSKESPLRDGQRIVGYQTEITDHGITDKRLLIIESEFASVLKVQGRDGNTLSATLRNAWDGDTLENRTKGNPATATGAHISIVAHITKDELLRHLHSTETINGYGNRFLWFASRRSKSLPEGGRISDRDLTPLADRVKLAIDFGRATQLIERDSSARVLWHRVYEKLSCGRPGILGSMTARGPAQVMRLAGIYALLDCSEVIRVDHLSAALAAWEYCESSCRYIFGDSLGNSVADEIVRALRGCPQGMTRTEIHGLFGRNLDTAKLNQGLRLVQSSGMAICTSEKDPKGGRPTERWFHRGVPAEE